MSSLQIAEISFAIGLVGYFIPTAYAVLLHKFRKQNSFVVIDNHPELIIKSNPRFNLLKSISMFFIYSLSTITVTANNRGTAYLQLAILYALSFGLALMGYLRKRKFAIIIDKEKQTLTRKGETYSLKEFNEFEISDSNIWLDAGSDSNGLYITGPAKKRQLIYGYSVFTDIEQLKKEIDRRLITP